jgi:hypothetical protein
MTASKSLPIRPSLESLRKQAKKLARDIAAGDAEAIARARVHLPHVDLSLTQRNAQLVIAREYGYAGWQDLTAEVSKRLGQGLEWAVEQARRIIHARAAKTSSLDSAAGTIMPSILAMRDRSFDLRHQLRRHLGHTMIVRRMGCDLPDQLLLGVGAGREAAP